MAIKLAIAVTDNEWFEMLRRRPDLDEVNFWAPGAKNFRALQRGEMFLFKLHAPRNVIVGGGIFALSNVMPCSLAWEAFGEANGARSEREMRARIVKYRSVAPGDRSDFSIGCRILTQPFFFEEPDWIPVPASWSPNIVSSKIYSTSQDEGRRLWHDVSDRLKRRRENRVADDIPQYGEPQTVRPRLGQGAFRVLVTDIYGRRCAVTQERTLPALDAAHIRPYSDGGKHEAHNGLLLRRDIHRLFDTGYVTVTPDFKFEVSHRIREEFENGRDYYNLNGRRIYVPKQPDLRPDSGSLAWHNDNCFRG